MPAPTKRLPAFIQPLAVALFFAALLASRVIQINDPDVFMHIRSGWWILQHRAIPRTDPFALFSLGMPWVDHQWLAQVAIALLAARPIGGLVTLSLVRAELIALSFYLVYRAMRLRGVAWPLALAAVFLGSMPAWSFSEPRPYIATYVFMAWIGWAWTRWKWRGGKALYFLPLAMLVWANCHGGATVGLLYLGALLVGEALERITIRGNAERGMRKTAMHRIAQSPTLAVRLRPLYPLGLVLLGALLASFLSPYGWRILLFPFQVVGKNILEARIFEWNAPTHEFDFYAYWLYLALFAVVCLLRWRRLALGDLLAALGFIYMSLTARRHIPLMVYATLPLLGAQLQAVWEWRPKLVSRRIVSIGAGLIIICCVLFDLNWGRTMAASDYLPLGLGMNPWAQPARAVDFLQSSPLNPNLFHDYDWGGYLIWRLHEPWRAFIDGRAEIYGAQGVSRYTHWMGGDPGWQQAFAQFHINTVMLDYQTVEHLPGLAQQLWASPDWVLVYWDDQAFIYARRDGLPASFIAANAYHAINPVWSTAELAQNAPKGPKREAVMAELDRALRENPRCVRALEDQSNLLAEAGRAKESAALCRRILAIEPHAVQARYRLARILDSWHDFEGAEREYKAVLRDSSNLPGALVRLGTIQERRGDFSGALAYYQRALRADSKNADARGGIARVETRGGK